MEWHYVHDLLRFSLASRFPIIYFWKFFLLFVSVTFISILVTIFFPISPTSINSFSFFFFLRRCHFYIHARNHFVSVTFISTLVTILLMSLLYPSSLPLLGCHFYIHACIFFQKNTKKNFS